MIADLLSTLKEKETELKLAVKAVNDTRLKIAQEKFQLNILESCRLFVLQVGKNTQSDVKEYIENTVTLALKSVYGEKYKFVVEFTLTKRDQVEMQFFIDKGGLLLEPRKDTMGYGVVDVAAFALRIVVWFLDDNPRSPAIMILDEPFKNPSSKFVPAIAEMMKETSRLMGIQFIMATHKEEFIENADTVYQFLEK